MTHCKLISFSLIFMISASANAAYYQNDQENHIAFEAEGFSILDRQETGANDGSTSLNPIVLHPSSLA